MTKLRSNYIITLTNTYCWVANQILVVLFCFALNIFFSLHLVLFFERSVDPETAIDSRNITTDHQPGGRNFFSKILVNFHLFCVRWSEKHI